MRDILIHLSLSEMKELYKLCIIGAGPKLADYDRDIAFLRSQLRLSRPVNLSVSSARQLLHYAHSGACGRSDLFPVLGNVRSQLDRAVRNLPDSCYSRFF